MRLVRSPCICLSAASPQEEPAAPSRPESVRLHLSDRRRGPSLEWHFNKPVWTSEDSNQSPTKGGNLSLSSFSVTQTTHTSVRTRGGRAHQRGRDTKAAAASLTPVSKYITRRRHFMLHNLQENCVSVGACTCKCVCLCTLMKTGLSAQLILSCCVGKL